MGLRRASQLAAVAGVLLLAANARGGSLLLEVGDEAAGQILPAEVGGPVRQVLGLLLFVGGLGGLAVLGGALLYRRKHAAPGNLLVGLGAGTGLLGVLLLAGLSLSSGQAAGFLGWLLGPAGLGVVLALLARSEAGPGLGEKAGKAATRAWRRLRR